MHIAFRSMAPLDEYDREINQELQRFVAHEFGQDTISSVATFSLDGLNGELELRERDIHALEVENYCNDSSSSYGVRDRWLGKKLLSWSKPRF